MRSVEKALLVNTACDRSHLPFSLPDVRLLGCRITNIQKLKEVMTSVTIQDDGAMLKLRSLVIVLVEIPSSFWASSAQYTSVFGKTPQSCMVDHRGKMRIGDSCLHQ